ncbi:MAG: cob(I)yrinic acid a,c-diamide adenosyltransferase [Gemmatimonadota bacterium]
MASAAQLPASPDLPAVPDRARAGRPAATGLVIVHVGAGKGKTTAALGLMTRAWGHGLRVGVVQFLKDPGVDTGERRAARRMDIDWTAAGDGFTWDQPDPAAGRALARQGWELAQRQGRSGQYDILILDELTWALCLGWLDTAEVVEWLAVERPPSLHVVVTGAWAPPELIERADLVTEMRLVKHPFADRGQAAQAGIEY